jgi:DNA-directed RNA polymerase specialized sigma24 family protein
MSRDPEIERGIELARRLLAVTDAETKEELKRDITYCCIRPIRNIVRRLVFARGFGPPGQDRLALVDDITTDVVVKVYRYIDTLKQPEQLSDWLRRTSMLTIIDAYKLEPEPAESLDKINDEGQEISRLDEGKDRIAALRNVGESLRIMADGKSWFMAIENRELLDKAAAIHSRGTKRDFQSACWLKVTWDYPTVPLEKIAAHRKTTVDDVYHLLRHDNKKLIPIVKELLGRTS